MSEEYKDGDQALPLYNLDAINSLSGFVETMFTLHGIKQECCLPARVVSYDRKTRLATVQPLVNYEVDTPEGKKYIERSKYENITVLKFGSNGFLMDFPLSEGDTGFLLAIDRKWTTAREKNSSGLPSENEGPQAADDNSVVSFENGVFIPSSYAYIADDVFDGVALRKIDKDGKDLGGIFLDQNGNTTIKNSLTTETDDKKVVINPDVLLGDSAKFNLICFPTTETYVDANGDTHIKTVKRYILADDEYEYGDDIVIGDKGESGIKDVSITTKSNVEDVPFSVEKHVSGNKITFNLVLGSKDDEDPLPSDKGGENYCNAISSERGIEMTSDDDSIGNDISSSLGGDESESGTNNNISYYPCVQ